MENTIGQLKFVVKRHVTLPLLKMEESRPYYLKFDSAIFPAPEGPEGRRKKDANGNYMPTPNLAHVTDLETGMMCQIIVNAVLGETLKEAYKDDMYKGKSFEVAKSSPTGGKRYATYQITEIEVQEESAAPKPIGKK